MENSQLRNRGKQKSGHARVDSEQGFALVSLLALVPLVAALILALASAFYFFKRKSLAQAHCVQQASQLQNELKDTLDQLLKLNRPAQGLRTQREVADRGLQAALSSANPYAIAAAKAYWTAVYLQQIALRAKQEALLRRADQQRLGAHREMRDRVRRLGVRAVESRKYYWRALAVEARPAASLTPDYVTLPMFQVRQQHRFKFTIDLRPPFAVEILPRVNLKQTTECSVSLKGSRNQWRLQILAANAPSKPSWF